VDRIGSVGKWGWLYPRRCPEHVVFVLGGLVIRFPPGPLTLVGDGWRKDCRERHGWGGAACGVYLVGVIVGGRYFACRVGLNSVVFGSSWSRFGCSMGKGLWGVGRCIGGGGWGAVA